MAKASTPASQIETITEDTQKTATDQMSKFTKAIEDMSSFGQGNMDAVMKSSEIATKVAEGCTSEVASFTKTTFEEGVSAMKDMASAQNVTEMMHKQQAFTTAMMDVFMKETSKMNEMVMSGIRDVFEPIDARATAAADLVKSTTA